MKLTRVVHTGTSVFFGPSRELVPDVADMGGGADTCLLFVDAGGEEAHAFFFTADQSRELARTMLGLEVARVAPPNGRKS